MEAQLTPQAGDIAVYDGHTGFPEGHIAVYIGNGEVFEQNADPDGSPAHIFSRANTYLLGYLTKGEDMGLTPEQVKISHFSPPQPSLHEHLFPLVQQNCM